MDSDTLGDPLRPGSNAVTDIKNSNKKVRVRNLNFNRVKLLQNKRNGSMQIDVSGIDKSFSTVMA